MAASSIEICNIMLTWISKKQIVSFDDGTRESDFCKANYESSRRAILESREWTFATVRELLSPLAETPLYGYGYAFLVPPSSLRFLGAYDPSQASNPDAPTIKHKLEIDPSGRRIVLANLQNIHARYIYNQMNSETFTPLFDQCLAAYLAYHAAMPLTQDVEQQRNMFGIYKDALEEATFNDSLQGSYELLETSQLERSRNLYIKPY